MNRCSEFRDKDTKVEYIQGDGFIIITEIVRVMDWTETGFAKIEYMERPVKSSITSASNGSYDLICRKGLRDKLSL